MEEYKDAYFGKSFIMVGRSLKRCFDCKYCRANDGAMLDYQTLPTEINPLFKEIPVAVNCFYGDPMLQVSHTIELMRRLEEAKHRGPVIIITKGDLRELMKEMGNWRPELDVHIGISTFGRDRIDIDPRTFDMFKRNMDVASKSGFQYSVEFRPIIRDVNDDTETLKRVIIVAREHKTGIGYCGLQMSENLRKRLSDGEIEFRAYDGHKFGLKKYVGRDVDREFRDMCREEGVPVFRKTSCLIAWKHGLVRDPNAHYYRPNEVGCGECPMKEKCAKFKKELSRDRIGIDIPFEYTIEEKTNHECGLYKLGICKFPSADCRNISGKLVKIEDELTTTDVRLIKWLTGYTVDARFRESPFCSDVWVKKR